MLTGQRAFDGEDMTDVLGAVVRLEPDWAALPASLPLAVRTLIQRCLVKDRRKRVADISVACAWGDADGRTLYVTARTGLYRIRTKVEGIRP
jgi:hypothetical protein